MQVKRLSHANSWFTMAVRFCDVILIGLVFVAYSPQTGKTNVSEIALSRPDFKIQNLHVGEFGCELCLGYTLPSSGDYLHPIRGDDFEKIIKFAQIVPKVKIYSCECCPEGKARIRDCGLCVEQ
ncbi:uncharacterized protein LOC106168910 [Lingula anatina]|uniref:Uncharacterized protein LOC106168910 n=1 Tax=Lingula anatina TaxID=7574 RepID=A0A1S3J046_LINAN|nr:uncharacterized protein LOC106168910 [Lingula anatina]|eukprot:XP_013403621.1 uncharacterized protein LOC106168910 [Lingula anatina]